MVVLHLLSRILIVYLLVVKGVAGITPLFNTHLAAGRSRVEMWGRVFECLPFYCKPGLDEVNGEIL